MNQFKYYHGFVFSIISVLFLFLLHHLPVNQLFIDPFSEAIKHQDLIDVFQNSGITVIQNYSTAESLS
ncbi:MAG: hypothetical protein IPN15_17025 [Saprospiraceae bacterium]|nr:hypothetical protein [Candidatus Vicinibacter affinis]